MNSVYVNIFFDMDNTLSVLTGDLSNENRGKREIDTKSHYFRDLKPNSAMKRLVELLTMQTHRVNNTTYCPTTYVLSKTTEGNKCKAAEQNYDKHCWRIEHYPEIMEKNVIILPNMLSKAKAIETLLDRELTPHDVLIDDYNPNLKEWQNHGGTAIKCVNQHNNATSWSGPYVKSNAKGLKELTLAEENLQTIWDAISTERVINIHTMDNLILDTFIVENYDNQFDQTIQKAIEIYQRNDLEFTHSVYPELKKAGYQIKTMKSRDFIIPA